MAWNGVKCENNENNENDEIINEKMTSMKMKENENNINEKKEISLIINNDILKWKIMSTMKAANLNILMKNKWKKRK